MRRKIINVSKAVRLRRPPKPKFAWTAIVIGLFGGEALAVIVEAAIGRPNPWIMLAGGIVGIVFGSLVEVGRYYWRRHKWHAATKS